jgi:serine/threonine-protein kinase SRPK3
MEHSGREYIRRLEGSFKLKSRSGSEYNVFIIMPLGISLRTLQEIQKNGILQQTVVVVALDQVLSGLKLLHKADVIHNSKCLLGPIAPAENSYLTSQY